MASNSLDEIHDQMKSVSPGRSAAIAGAVLWWAGIVGLLLVGLSKIEWFYFVLRQTPLSALVDPSLSASRDLMLTRIITPIRGFAFLGSLSVVIYAIVRDVRRAEKQADPRSGFPRGLGVILVFLVLCVLFPPGQLSGLANEYSNSSLVFFTRPGTLSYHQRFLMPLVANILFFRGDLWFALFSLLCALGLVFALRAWFDRQQVPVKLWQLVSLGTASFVSFQISVPGYPDVLVAIFMVVAFTYSLSTRAQLSLFALALAAHEGSLIIWLPLAWILLDRKGLLQFLVIAGLYVVIWSMSERGFLAVFTQRQSDAAPILTWVLENYKAELLGILFAFRGLWMLVVGAFWKLVGSHNYRESAQIALILAAGFGMTLLGADTSRLFGWAFIAILLCWKVLARLGSNRWNGFLNAALVVNLLIPPVYIQLNLPPGIGSGLYATIINYVSGPFLH